MGFFLHASVSPLQSNFADLLSLNRVFADESRPVSVLPRISVDNRDVKVQFHAFLLSLTRFLFRLYTETVTVCSARAISLAIPSRITRSEVWLAQICCFTALVV